MGLAMTIICVLYALFGFFGYLRYGTDLKGDDKGSVTLNIPKDDMYVMLLDFISSIYGSKTFTSTLSLSASQNAFKSFSSWQHSFPMVSKDMFQFP